MQREWIEAGYFIVADAARPDLGSCSLPHRRVTISTCIVDSYPDWWALPWARTSEDELEKRRVSLDLDPSQFAALRAWVADAVARGEYGWPNVFLTLGSAREFHRRFLAGRTGQRVLGASVARDVAARFVRDEAPSGKNAAPGVWSALSRERRAERGGQLLGFDIVGAEVGGSFHTFSCNDLERDFAAHLGIQLNAHGLIDEAAHALAASEYVNRGDVGAEPVNWYPMRIVEYEFAAPS